MDETFEHFAKICFALSMILLLGFLLYEAARNRKLRAKASAKATATEIRKQLGISNADKKIAKDAISSMREEA